MRLILVASSVLVLVGFLLLVPLVGPTRADDPADEPGSGDADPRVGTVLAVQGNAYVRPVGHRRWSPLAKDALLMPGDLVKTAARGANALEVSLEPEGALLLGPGSLVEIPERGTVRVLSGEVEEKGAAGTRWLRVKNGLTRVLEAAPRWVTDYRATVGEEWMGSLLANVDGRDVPLAVGYHKVTADIRDQIARTTVEQSFINTTDARLEGVFYFPLPADASISGFGMWIGDELVEADVVEKARARQIYEDILRRKKDPGLLEWQGGNLFKARVFPIEPRSEKRVRIRYTQVLPLEGTTFRYRYALRSDLLRSKPLRRLDIQVSVDSAQTIQQVVSPSHPCRIRQTDDVARVEFDAEEYVPERDFEVAVTLAPSPGVQAIAHRRGDDGFFMLLVQPPAAEGGGWKRDLVPDGDPLDVILVADTSGSTDAAGRATQTAFLEAFLALLSEEDRFRLVAADVDVHQPFDEARPPTDENVAAALAFLAARPSLGWTDLDRTMDRVLAMAGPETLVVYVGDGIPTAGDADAQALADRLRLRGKQAPATVHAVAAASTYEDVVLQALATIGGGSVRRADSDPSGAAHGLLAEVARPVLRDVAIQIGGIPTARVYPEPLPNLPVGTQHAVIGRFLPVADVHAGEVVLTGTLDGKAVTYRTVLDVPSPDAGNSFLPRLWARKHLDALLAQGRSAAIQAEIVEFSQSYGIMTPYTSFLVLESDEDRERYGVARTAQMRDGEAFFSAGRDKVALEMLRQHTRQAKAWRQGLRRTMQKEIAGLGRDLVPTASLATLAALGEQQGGHAWGAEGKAGSVTAGVPVAELRRKGRHRGAPASKDAGFSTPRASLAAEPVIEDAEIADHVETDNDLFFEESLGESMDFDGPVFGSIERTASDEKLSRRQAFAGRGGRRRLSEDSGVFYNDDRNVRSAYGRPLGSIQARPENIFELREPGVTVHTLGWPVAPSVWEEPQERPKPDWDPHVFELLEKLDRREALQAGPGGVQVRWVATQVHPVRGDALSSETHEVLYGPGRFFVRTEAANGEVHENALDGEMRTRVQVNRRLGRRRPAAKTDERALPEALGGVNARHLAHVLRHHHVYVSEFTRGTLMEIRIEGQSLADADRVWKVDPRRGVIVSERTLQHGRTTRRIHRSGFVEVAGLWWPRLTEVFDERGRRVAYQTREIAALERSALEEAIAARTADYGDVIFLGPATPTVADARQAIKDGDAAFADHLAIVCEEAGRQRHPEARAAWDRARALEAGKPGLVWPDLVLLTRARSGTELLAVLEVLTKRLENQIGDDASWWARNVYGLVSPRLSADERLLLLERLGSPWVSAGTQSDVAYHRLLGRALRDAGRFAASRRVRRDVLARAPYDAGAISDHANDLEAIGDYAAARGVLERLLSADRQERVFTDQERTAHYGHLLNILFGMRDLPAVEATLARCIEDVPTEYAGWYRRLSLLYFQGEVAAADAWVLLRLASEVRAGIYTQEFARLHAALELALGSGWHLSFSTIDPAFLPALVDVGRRLARAEPFPGILLQQILGSWKFRRTDGHRLLLQALRTDLEAGDAIATMGARRLLEGVRRLPWGPSHVEAKTFASVVSKLEARFGQLREGRERDAVAEALLHCLTQHQDPKRVLYVLRAWRKKATGFRRTKITIRLFEAILKSDDLTLEDEAYGLLPDLLDPLEPDRHEGVAASASRRLAAWGYERRRVAARGTPDEEEGRTRAEARAHARQAMAEARRGLAARLEAARDAAPDAYRRWLEVERLGYAVELGEDLAAVQAAAWELLDSIAKTSEEPLDHVIAERASLVLAFAALRSNAPEGLAEEVLRRFEGFEKDEVDERLDWRYQILRLLIALDRVEEVESALRAWTKDDARVVDPWRIVLAYLVAERSRLEEAAALLEGEAVRGGLSAAQYELLAGWHLALGNDDARARALQGRYDAMSEYDLRNLLSNLTPSTRRGGAGMPADVDPEAFRVLRTLLRKASDPDDHLWRIRRFYEAVRDHRTLAALAEGVPGHTPGAIYDYLQALAPIVAKVFEEATVDEAVAAIQARRATVSHDHERRGLYLLEAMLRARAGLVKNPDPAHLEQAATAFESVGRGAWEKGERRRLALLLASLPKIETARLARVQVALLQALLAATPVDSAHRLIMADALARTYWAHDEREGAWNLLSSALDAERLRTGRPLSHEALQVFYRLIDWWTKAGHFREAETALTDEMGRQAFLHARTDLLLRTFRLWGAALEKGGTVSLGSGAALLDGALTRVDAFLAEGLPSRARQAVTSVGAMHRGAKKSGAVPDAGERMAAWASERLPTFFDRLLLERTWCARDAANGIAAVAPAETAVAYVLDQLDAEPSWYPRIGYGLWQNTWRDLAKSRVKAGNLGPLAPRLLVPVSASLESYLRSGTREGRYFWDKGNSRFWSEQIDAFTAAAMRVAEIEAHDLKAQVRAARYLRELGQKGLAVAVLQTSRAREVADAGTLSLLATWLAADGRRAEAVPVVEELLARFTPTTAHYIVAAKVHHGAGHEEKACGLLAEAERTLREKDRWRARDAFALAQAALEIQDYAASEAWLRECLALLAERKQASTSGHYVVLARALAGQGRVDDAVEAAATAIGKLHPRRRTDRKTNQVLADVLKQAEDLDAFVTRYEARVAKEGLDAPLLRKAIAKVYTERDQAVRAIPHLLAARELAPEDAAVHQQLVVAYDATGNVAGAIDALFASLRMAPRNLEAAADLARRLQDAGRTVEAERAWTNLVEPLPEEAAGHRRLAGARQHQDRWADAVVQWKQAVRTDPLDPTGWLSLGKAAARTGDVAEARKAYEHVLNGTWEARHGKVKEAAAKALSAL